MVKNIPSVKLLKKLDFQEEGLLRAYGYWKGQFHDLRMYSLLKREYINLSEWSKPQPTQNPGEVMSVLSRRIGID